MDYTPSSKGGGGTTSAGVQTGHIPDRIDRGDSWHCKGKRV